MAKRVVVVDEDQETRSYFKKILQSTRDFDLAGDFSDGGEALAKVPILRPHIVLLGIPLSGFNGIEWIRRCKQVLVGLKIIILTGMADPSILELSMQAGAERCLVKPLSREQCLATLRFMEHDRIQNEATPPNRGVEILSVTVPGKGSSLSRREDEVMDGLAAGLLYKEIADKLGISYSAVHKYQHKLFAKLRVSNRSEAIRLWLSTTTRL